MANSNTVVDRNIGGPGTFQDLIDVEGCATKLVVVVRTICQEAARLDVFPALKGGRQARVPRKLCNQCPMLDEGGIGEQHHTLRPILAQSREAPREFFGGAGSTIFSSRPIARAASSTPGICTAEPGLAGLTRTPTCFMAGTISRNNSTSLPLRSGLIGVTPVTFPPGRARLATNPVPTRSRYSPRRWELSRSPSRQP